MITIGVAIMLNRGTNLSFGEISFVTNAAGSVLQLAVSMDYSIGICYGKSHRIQSDLCTLLPACACHFHV